MQVFVVKHTDHDGDSFVTGVWASEQEAVAAAEKSAASVNGDMYGGNATIKDHASNDMQNRRIVLWDGPDDAESWWIVPHDLALPTTAAAPAKVWVQLYDDDHKNPVLSGVFASKEAAFEDAQKRADETLAEDEVLEGAEVEVTDTKVQVHDQVWSIHEREVEGAAPANPKLTIGDAERAAIATGLGLLFEALDLARLPKPMKGLVSDYKTHSPLGAEKLISLIQVIKPA